MIKLSVFVGFQATAITIETVTQSTSIISKSSQTLYSEIFRIKTSQNRQLVGDIRQNLLERFQVNKESFFYGLILVIFVLVFYLRGSKTLSVLY